MHKNYKFTYLDHRSGLISDPWYVGATSADQPTNQCFRNHHVQGYIISCKIGCPKDDVVIRQNIKIHTVAKCGSWKRQLFWTEKHWITWSWIQVLLTCSICVRIVYRADGNHLSGWVFPKKNIELTYLLGFWKPCWRKQWKTKCSEWKFKENLSWQPISSRAFSTAGTSPDI